MMKLNILCYAGLLSLPLTALAMDAGPASAQQQGTEVWLQLQGRNTVASSIPQIATPAERELSMQRWLKSYQHEIPALYEQKMAGRVKSN